MMNSRQLQPFLNNSLAIRHEITRFESVHPSIYAIYDLIELIPDQNIAQQIRDHVVCIEDSFVNSQEWTLSRSVPDLRLGILGSLSSGKSALVHRYLTGSYMQEESPEGGRFKKEILVDNSSYLLLIRDEGGPPELQFTAWVDAVIFVFSLEDESSFNAIYSYYTKMSHFRNPSEIPIILVGTQDAISENNPRVIDDARARKLASDLKRCSYYETCATYGLNVERVFQDACQKIVQQRQFQLPTCLTPSNSRPGTPSGNYAPVAAPRTHHVAQVAHNSATPNGINSSPHSPIHHSNMLSHKESQVRHYTLSTHHIQEKYPQLILQENNNIPKYTSTAFDNQIIGQQNSDSLSVVSQRGEGLGLQVPPTKTETLPTPNATPTTTRKTRRRSNLFTPRKGQNEVKNGCELGSGRAIPLKQGYLYKRSGKTLNKDWKKKYVTLCDDGRLTYYPSLHDYMDDSHGKEISLQYVTVKVPGQKPRGSKSIITVAGTGANSGPNGINEALSSLSLSSYNYKENKRATDKALLSALDVLKEPGAMRLASQASGDETTPPCLINGDSKIDTPNVKKRHRRMKSSGIKNSELDDGDGFEFYIVSLDNKQWHFEAASSDERVDWVVEIEQQILTSLQSNESCKKPATEQTSQSIQSIRSRVPGNSTCVDCDSPNPDWASLNLGVLMCIECSGIHRNLGSHISRVRSLDLDEWPAGHLACMLSIGNTLANSVWEGNAHSLPKPLPQSPREEKERYIRAKYENKEFLPTLASHAPGGGANIALGPAQQLVDAVCRSDIKQIIIILANHGGADVVNGTVSRMDLRTPLHLACAMGNLAIAQLLIWNNANISALDHEKRTCLTYAKAAANLAYASKTQSNNSSTQSLSENARGLVELLLSHGCPETSSNGLGTLGRRRPSIGNRTKDQQIPNSVV